MKESSGLKAAKASFGLAVDPKPFPQRALIAIRGMVELAASQQLHEGFDCHVIDPQTRDERPVSRGECE